MRIMAAVKARAKALNVIDVLHRKKAGMLYSGCTARHLCRAPDLSLSLSLASALPLHVRHDHTRFISLSLLASKISRFRTPSTLLRLPESESWDTHHGRRSMQRCEPTASCSASIAPSAGCMILVACRILPSWCKSESTSVDRQSSMRELSIFHSPLHLVYTNGEIWHDIGRLGIPCTQCWLRTFYLFTEEIRDFTPPFDTSATTTKQPGRARHQ